MAVFRHEAPTPEPYHLHMTVEVPSGYVVVGGGAIGAESPGALLIESRPDDDWGAWVVSSTEHRIPCPHILTGFAIGLSIKGMSRDELAASMAPPGTFSTHGDETNSPEATTQPMGSEYVLIG